MLSDLPAFRLLLWSKIVIHFGVIVEVLVQENVDSDVRMLVLHVVASGRLAQTPERFCRKRDRLFDSFDRKEKVEEQTKEEERSMFRMSLP